jgi:hypothetical protein
LELKALGDQVTNCGAAECVSDPLRPTRTRAENEAAAGGKREERAMLMRVAMVMAWALQQTASDGGGEPRQCTREWATPLKPDMSLKTPAPDEPGVQPRKLRMDNTCAEPVVVMWVNEHGAEVEVKRLEPGRRLSTATTGGAVFRAYFVDETNAPVQLALEHKVSRLDPRMRHVDIAPCGPQAARFVIEGAAVTFEKPEHSDTLEEPEPDIVARELLQQNKVNEDAPLDEDDDTILVFSVLGGICAIFGFMALSAVLPTLMRGDLTTRHQKRLAMARESAEATRYPNPKVVNSESEDESDSSDSSEEENEQSSEEEEEVVVALPELSVHGAVRGNATPTQPQAPGAAHRQRQVLDGRVSPTSSVHELRQKLAELGARDHRLAQLISDGGLDRPPTHFAVHGA